MMKKIDIWITEETFNKLYAKARNENKTLSDLIQSILAKETGTCTVYFPRRNEQKK